MSLGLLWTFQNERDILLAAANAPGLFCLVTAITALIKKERRRTGQSFLFQGRLFAFFERIIFLEKRSGLT